jgi:predicted mannosyl-3-phosphoglycerate phosphatase (HAD superfamily)
MFHWVVEFYILLTDRRWSLAAVDLYYDVPMAELAVEVAARAKLTEECKDNSMIEIIGPLYSSQCFDENAEPVMEQAAS